MLRCNICVITRGIKNDRICLTSEIIDKRSSGRDTDRENCNGPQLIARNVQHSQQGSHEISEILKVQ